LRSSRRVWLAVILSVAALAAAWWLIPHRRSPPHAARQDGARSLLLITIDTLRADAVGAYGPSTSLGAGSAGARTPAIDALAARGVRFDRAFAPAPITLPSHASVLTGRDPPGHGARHNGMAMRGGVPTIATVAAQAGFATAAFVSAFPLDRRFGLARGFGAYSDRMPRGADMRPANERSGARTVDEAVEWLGRHAPERFLLWVHLFEPHAPYGDPQDGRPARARYADEVAEADRQVARLVTALGVARAETLVVVAGDHGEAFGEHGEIGHSIFVYDTTLRVPLVFSGAGLPGGTVVAEPVSLIDVAPTALRLLALPPVDADGVDIAPLWYGERIAPRTLYAESFAPLVDFGWSALRSVRRDGWKYIAAPRPELYDLLRDPDEAHDVAGEVPARAAALADVVARVSGPELDHAAAQPDPEAARRLRALGYASSSPGAAGVQGGKRPDPKDRRNLAARIARVTSGELTGNALRRELEAILLADVANPQAHMRLAFVLSAAGACTEAEPHFRSAIAAGLPSADPFLGLAGCQARGGDRAAALRTLERGLGIEPDNPVVLANSGIIQAELGRQAEAVDALRRAVDLDHDFHEARFNLALALARAGRRAEAAREAQTLRDRLPPDAPQRAEVKRLLRALRDDGPSPPIR
jgi:arylsulfatase A-like enzyme